MLSKKLRAQAFRDGAAWLEANPKKWIGHHYCMGPGRCAMGAVALAAGCTSKDNTVIQDFLDNTGLDRDNEMLNGEENIPELNDEQYDEYRKKRRGKTEFLSEVTKGLRLIARKLEHGWGRSKA